MRFARLTWVVLLALAPLSTAPYVTPAAAAPEGQMTWGVHVSLVPLWFDPADAQGIITPFMVMYAIHDAMAKAMPGNPLAPSLAESWKASPDSKTYDFTLRKGVKFHNGDPLTSEDVKFSFERYRGSTSKMLKDRVAAIETPDSLHVRFRLKSPWPERPVYGTAA
jgi:peptide/nickel transport system substrate-binding protein